MTVVVLEATCPGCRVHLVLSADGKAVCPVCRQVHPC